MSTILSDDALVIAPSTGTKSLVFQPQDGCATYDAPRSTPVDPKLFDDSIPAVRAYK